ncbi:MAG: LysR family transcriptional regulator [Myxococcaceae bacterium]|nr:MAG: LysR family transcriptional regulator [Myxococcaceae bacterium]
MVVQKRPAPLDWEDLRFFVALARAGSLSAAARQLKVSHATVGRRVAALEDTLGRALFDRRVDGYALTAEGAAVLELATGMDERALAILRRAGQESGGAVRGGASGLRQGGGATLVRRGGRRPHRSAATGPAAGARGVVGGAPGLEGRAARARPHRRRGRRVRSGAGAARGQRPMTVWGGRHLLEFLQASRAVATAPPRGRSSSCSSRPPCPRCCSSPGRCGWSARPRRVRPWFLPSTVGRPSW